MKTPPRILIGSIFAFLINGLRAQNVVDLYTGPGDGSMNLPGNWSLGVVPVITNDAVFSLTPNIRTLSLGAITVGSLNVTANSGTYSIRNETSTSVNSTLILGGVGNLGNSVSGVAGDIFYAASGSVLNIRGDNPLGAGVLGVVLGQSGNFNLAGTASSTISSVISDGGSGFGLTKTGTGGLILQGTSTFTGAIGVSLGTLTLGTGLAGQNGVVASLSIVDNAALVFNNADAQAYAGVMSGLGTLTKIGAGMLTLVNANTLTGTTTITAGTLQLGTGVTGQNGSLASANINNNSTLNWNNFDALGVGSTIIGTGVMTKTSTGTLSLLGSNTYTGSTTISSGGVVNIQNGLALGGAGAGTTVNGGGALEIQGNILTLIEALTLNGSGVSSGGGLRNLSGVNIYNGGVTLASASRINADGGRLILNNSVNTAGFALTLGGAGNLSAASAIGGSGGLIKDGTGTLGIFGANTYTGNSTLSGGVTLLGSAEAVNTTGPLGKQLAAAAGTILFNGGTLQYSPQNNTDYSGRFSTTGGQAIHIDTNSRAVAVATSVVGLGTSFAKSGFGTLTLGGVNSYDGGTTVSGGTLLAVAAGNLPNSGTLEVRGGGTFSMVNGGADSGYVTDRLSLTHGATLAFDWVGGATDVLTSTTAATTAGVIGLGLNPLSAPVGPQTLVASAGGGLTLPNGTQYFLANNTNYTATLTASDTAVSIDGIVTGLTALTNNAFWYGNTLAGVNASGVDNALGLSNGAVSNWSTTTGSYTATALVPGSAANVIFSATGATQQGNLVLGADMSLNSLTFNDSTPLTISSGHAVTLLSAGTGSGSAVSVNQDATINAGVILGGNQTWTTAGGKTLTLGGTIGNVTAGAGLTIAGAGTAVINGTAAYSGATTVNNGATLTFSAGSKKTYLGAGNTLVVNGVVNVGGDVDVQNFSSSQMNGVINVSGTGALTLRSAEGNQDSNAGIGGGGYGMLNIAGGVVSVLASGGAPGSMNMMNGGSQALLRITGGVLNAGTMMVARNGGGTSEITITGGIYNKATGPLNLGDRGGFTTVLNLAGGLIDNTSQQMTWGRAGGSAGSSLVVMNFDAGSILTKEVGVSGQGGFQVIANYNGGTIKLSPGVNANFYSGTAAATSSLMSYVNGSFGAFSGGVVMDTNASNTTINGNLLAPTGNGVNALPLISGGAGYTGAPIVSITDSGITQVGTTNLTNTLALANTTGVFVGQSITGTGIPLGSIVTAITANTAITISQITTLAGAPTLTFKGQGATAYATASAGSVTGLIVTNPGVGYVGTVSVALGGGFGTGGSGTAATLGAIGIAANSSGGLTKNGLGILTLPGANTFTGGLAVNDGTLAFAQALGVTNTYGAISGAGSISQTGAGTTILGGANTYSGVTTISAGVLQLNQGNALPGGIATSGGTGALTFNGGVLGLGAGDFSRSLGNAGLVTAANFNAAGGWAAYGANRVVNLGGAGGTVVWATPGAGFNAQTLIFGNVTATHAVDLQNALDLGSANRTVQVDNGGGSVDGQFSGLISGAGVGITKTGAGTLVLSNSGNNYSGTMNVNVGTMLTSNNEVLPNGSSLVVNGNVANFRAILNLNGNDETVGALFLGSATASSESTVATGSGTLILGGGVTYTSSNFLGATILGKLSLGSVSRTFAINDSNTAANDLSIPAVISGAGVGLTKSLLGNLWLAGANTYTGGTTVNGGVLTLGRRVALYNDTPTQWTPSLINVDAGATLALGVGSSGLGYFDVADLDTLLDASHLGLSTPTSGLKSSSMIGFDTTNATGGAFTYGSVIANPGTALTVGVTKLGAGSLTLGGNNTYGGQTTLSSGTLILSGINAGTGAVTINGGVLRANQGVGLNAGSLLTISGGVFETGANLERTGGSAAGNMQITGGGTAGFSANGGAVQVAFGTLASPTALTWNTAPFVVGVFNLNGVTANNTLEFKNAINLNGATRTIQVDANVATISGILSNGGVTKTGNGTLTLSAINSYAGSTIVAAGTLQVNGATGSLAATTTLTLGAGGQFTPGAFIYDNVGAVSATSQTLASLNTVNSNSHDNIVQVTRTAAQTVNLIFTTVASNTTEQGNIINFVTNDLATGGVNGTDYKIVLADQTTLKISKQNAYFNGSAFAVYQGSGLTGYVRGISYGVDLNTATSGAGLAFANPGTLTSQEITGTITAQPATTLVSGTLNGSLKIVGASDLTMQLNASLTLNGAGNTGTGGILKTGGGTSVMSGGVGTTGVVNLSNTQGDIRVDGLTDVLNISMPITWSGPTRLLKSGAGTLIFSSGTLPFTDSRNTMYINGGVFEIGGAALYNGPAANTLVLASGTTFRYNSSNVASFRSGSITGLGNLEVKAGALSLTSTANSYTGTTTLDGGILNVVSLANGGVASSLGGATNAASKLVFGGGTLRFNGTAAGASDRLFTIGDAAGNSATLDASGTTLAAFVNFSNTGAMAFGNNNAHTLTLTGSNGGANNLAAAIGDNVGATSITKTGAGSWLLSGANTYSGATTISAGTLEVAVGGGIGDASAVSLASVAGARLLVSSSETIGSLSGGSGANGEVSLGFNTLTLGDGSSATFEGTIGGTAGKGGVTKQGTGVENFSTLSVLTFDRLTANDGTTNVNSGLGTGAGTAAVVVSDTAGGAATHLRFGSVSQTLSSLSIGAGGVVTFTSGVASGAFSGGGEKLVESGGQSVVPEPGTVGLLLLGGLGILGRRRR